MAPSVWAVAGAQKTLAVGLGRLSAVLLGTMTAVGGGAIRGLLLVRTPAIFGGTPLHATVAVLVSGVMVECSRFGAPTLGILAGIVVGVSLRLAVLTWGRRLPGSGDWRPGGVARPRVLTPMPDRKAHAEARKGAAMPPRIPWSPSRQGSLTFGANWRT
ncbi:TRIC cation channel family protein [Streptomyces sp. NPDC088337]|uniref:TRIC cation channel family protein n=1 Tax=unclassified Streptomyces TaxID=2593676 RepID=UPI0037FBE327